MSDIIDNRSKQLVDQIQTILPSSEVARFAVGYFFLSGLIGIGPKLGSLKELKLLIGNTVNKETIELLTEGHRRLDLVKKRLDAMQYAKRSDQKKWVEETAKNLRESIEVMDQTDEGEQIVKVLLRLIEEKKIKVRVYTKGRLHAKAYIFDHRSPVPGNSGIAIVGSSNLTLSGISHNTELNVVVHDNANLDDPKSGNHGELVNWFEELWDESQEFASHLVNELKQSWAAQLATPYDIYMKTLYTLVKDRLEGTEDKEILWDDDITRHLADFQKVAVRQAIQMIREYGGCFVSDVVGLGKSYIGAGIIKHFDRTEHIRPLIICPKPLEEMWSRYNERYELNAQILPMSMLQAEERGVNLFEDPRYKDRDFVLIDESHNFRHHTSQRYQQLQSFLSTGRRVCLLTATPRNSRAFDVYNQIKLFHPEDITALPIDPPNLKEYFKSIDKGDRRLQDLLTHLLIRRTRRHILRWYGYAEDSGEPLRNFSDEKCNEYLNGGKRAYVMVAGRHQFFPKRKLETLRYSIEDTYNGLYQELRGYLGRPFQRVLSKDELAPRHLLYARYGIWHYVKDDKKREAPYHELKRAGINLRGLIRTMLFKRFESSVEAFRKSIKRMIRTHEMFLKSLENDIVPAGDDVDTLLGQAGTLDDEDLLEAISLASGRYDISDFNSKLLKKHVESDISLLRKMLKLVEVITPAQDDKLQVFLKRIRRTPIKDNKCLIFTQFTDTAEYIFANLNPKNKIEDIDIIFGADKSKMRMVRRFAPKSNPELPPKTFENEIRLLVTTDVLAEGLNLQDCNVVLNYDLHWNPVRLIQRIGRIDRIGTEHETVYGLNFLPETALEKELGIAALLSGRIQEIHDTIGEDAAILDNSEKLNSDAMYSIYVKGEFSNLEGEEDELMDLSEAEEFFRNLAKDDPSEYERIVNLRDGIRAARKSNEIGTYVFFQAGRYNKLTLWGKDGQKLTSDIPHVLRAVVANKYTESSSSLPKDFNKIVMKAKNQFDIDVQHQESFRYHSFSLSPAQRYVLRELRALYALTEEDDDKSMINRLEKAFRMTPTAAVSKELNSIRRNSMMGQSMQKALITIFHNHRLSDRLSRADLEIERLEIPRIICSEAL